MENKHFVLAKPVWLKNREYDKNLTCSFKSIIKYSENEKVLLHITASSSYRLFVNGEFKNFGPARTAHGFYRVDVIELSNMLCVGDNNITIEVASYNVNSFYVLDQPGFLQAEIIKDEKVIIYTSEKEAFFDVRILEERITKVQRYSFQRPFTEAYYMTDVYEKWKHSKEYLPSSNELIQVQNKITIDRNIPFPTYEKIEVKSVIQEGVAKFEIPASNYFKDRSLHNISSELKGFPKAELEVCLSDEAQEIKFEIRSDEPLYKTEEFFFDKNEFKTFDFGVNKSGFIGTEVIIKEKTTIYLLFDEILTNGDVDFLRLDCCSVVKYDVEPGHYHLETYEPYTLRYLKIVGKDASFQVKSIYIREFVAGVTINAEFDTKNENLKMIYEAAVETFKQNATDLFMDCPSRERAGWLCDSFFTSRAEYYLTGKNDIEKNFLENYLLPDKFFNIPEGMLPMCYPADHYDGVFIPNWALWMVIELEDYLKRNNSRDLVNNFKEKVYKLFEYFKPFQNEYGLLEKLNSWVFIEWSKANEFVQDVNFPTNMLYGAALEAAGRIYQDDVLIQQGVTLKENIRNLAFDGEFFRDHAIREEGELVLCKDRTEVCQYYAFFFEVATPNTHKVLWNILVEEFGPDRKNNNLYPDIYFANSFIGNYLRQDMLLKYNYPKKVLKEVENYFKHMAKRSGTLWEYDDEQASCNHGFTSIISYWLLKARETLIEEEVWI